MASSKRKIQNRQARKETATEKMEERLRDKLGGKEVVFIAARNTGRRQVDCKRLNAAKAEILRQESKSDYRFRDHRHEGGISPDGRLDA